MESFYQNKIDDYTMNWITNIDSYIQYDTAPSVCERNVALVSDLVGIDIIDDRMEEALHLCFRGTEEDIKIEQTGDTIKIQYEHDVPHNQTGLSRLDIEIKIDGESAYFTHISLEEVEYDAETKEVNIIKTLTEFSPDGESVLKYGLETTSPDGEIKSFKTMVADTETHTATERSYSSSLQSGGENISTDTIYTGYEKMTYDSTLIKEVKKENLPENDKECTQETLKTEDGNLISSHTKTTEYLPDGSIHVQSVETKSNAHGESYIEKDYISKGHHCTDGYKLEIETKPDGEKHTTEHTYSEIDGKIIQQTMQDGIIIGEDVVDLEKDAVVEYVTFKETDAGYEASRFYIDSSQNEFLISRDIVDNNGNIIENIYENRDKTTYDLVLIPDKFSAEGIEKAAIYNTEDSASNIKSLYGYEFYRDGELIGFSHCEEQRDKYSAEITITSVDFRTDFSERTVCRASISRHQELGEIRIEHHTEPITVTYDKETHEVTYVEHNEGDVNI